MFRYDLILAMTWLNNFDSGYIGAYFYDILELKIHCDVKLIWGNNNNFNLDNIQIKANHKLMSTDSAKPWNLLQFTSN